MLVSPIQHETHTHTYTEWVRDTYTNIHMQTHRDMVYYIYSQLRSLYKLHIISNPLSSLFSLRLVNLRTGTYVNWWPPSLARVSLWREGRETESLLWLKVLNRQVYIGLCTRRNIIDIHNEVWVCVLYVCLLINHMMCMCVCVCLCVCLCVCVIIIIHP